MERDVKTISECDLWRFNILMIFVMLGTQNNSFHRLLEEIDKLIEKKVIKEKVVAQIG